METKSRYEVISEMEKNKRDLIRERDGLNDQLLEKQKKVKAIERQKNDTVIILDRQIEDVKEDIANFEKTLVERKETIKELITSIDASLSRFSQKTQ